VSDGRPLLELEAPGPASVRAGDVDAWRERGRDLERLRAVAPERYAAELSRLPASDPPARPDAFQLDLSQAPLELEPPPAGVSVGAALDTKEQVEKIRRSPENPTETWQKAARAKGLTFPLAVALAEYAKQAAPARAWLPDGTLEYAYRRAIYCADEMHEQEDGRVVARLCGARWCLRCNTIRTARAWSKYGPVAEAAPVPLYMATVTVPNVKAGALRDTLAAFLEADRRVRGRMKKRGRAVSGLRKLEVTWNSERDDFHPHYHFVIEGQDVAREYVSEWLKEWPAADPKGQDVRPVKDLAEVLKYFTKIVTKLPGGKIGIAPAEPLDVIFSAMYARRVWQPLGSWYNATRGAEDEEGELIEYVALAPKPRGRPVRWLWSVAACDWGDYDGAWLSGYARTRAVARLVKTLPEMGDIPPPPPSRAERAGQHLREYAELRNAERRDH
jgi:hypothetical protein